jgi:hypothetical protein
MQNALNVFEEENEIFENVEVKSKFGKIKNTLTAGLFFGEKALTEKGGVI